MVESIQLDDSHWPLLLVRFTDVATERQYEEYLAGMDAVLRRREPFVSISDATRVGLYTPSSRARQAAWLQCNDALLRTLVLGHATIVTSPLVRLSLNLLHHLKPLPFPHVGVANMDSALAWVTHRLRESGRAAEAERILRHFGPGAESHAG